MGIRRCSVFLLAGLAVLLAATILQAGEPITANFWYSYGGKNREVTEELIKRFNSSQTKYRIEGAFQGDYFQALAKIRAAISTKTAPAIFHAIGEVLPNLWDTGLLENLEAYAKGPAGTRLEDFVPALTQDGYFDYFGQKVPLFAIPFNRSTPILYYNPEMLRAKGVKPPTSWDELRQAAAKLTTREGAEVKTWGFEMPISWWFWYAFLYQAGGQLLSADGKQAVFAEKGTEVLRYWTDLIVTDKTMKRPPGKDYNAWEVTNTDFINEKAAMIITSTAFLAYLTENAKFPVGAAFLPGKAKLATPTGGTFFVMIKDATPAQKEAGWAFIRWMSEPEQTVAFCRPTGYMPVRISAIQSPGMQQFYREQPNYRVAYDQLQYAVRFPFSPVLFEIQRDQIQNQIEAPLLGLKTAEETMAQSVRGSNALLKRP